MEPNKHENETTSQIADFHEGIAELEKEGYKAGVNKARNMLFLAAGLILAGEVIGVAIASEGIDPLGAAIVVFIVGIFIALAIWTKKKPFTAIVGGLIAFISYILLNAVLLGYADGADGVFKGLFGGIIFKIIILAALIRPLKDAKELQRIMEQH